MRTEENNKNKENLFLDFLKMHWSPSFKSIDNKVLSGKIIANKQEEVLRFEIYGEAFKSKTMAWSSNIELDKAYNCSYITMLYRAEFLEREKPCQPVVTVCNYKNNKKCEQNENILFKMSNLINDGCWHRITVRKNIQLKDIIKISINICTFDSCGYLEVKSIEFSKTISNLNTCLLFDFDEEENDKRERNANSEFYLIPLEKLFNYGYDTLLEHLLEREITTTLLKRKEESFIVDGGKFFEKSLVRINNIPFIVNPKGNNIIKPPEESGINDEIIEYFGMKVKRGLVWPVSRDDVITIKANVVAYEVYFLAVAEIPPFQQFKFIGLDFPIDGQIYDEVLEPFRIEDVERFTVELVYEDGTHDFAFPYSVREKRHVIQGMVGVYAVPARGCILKELRFHNMIRGGNIHIAAVTVNTKKSLIFGTSAGKNRQHCTTQKFGFRPEEKNMHMYSEIPYIREKNGILEVGNRYLKMNIDIMDRFSIKTLESVWLPKGTIKFDYCDSFLIIPINKDRECCKNADNYVIKLLSSHERNENGSAGIDLVYSCIINNIPFECRITVLVGEEAKVSLKLAVTNLSQDPVNITVLFPVFRNLCIGNNNDTWYLFPKYRNILSNQQGTFIAQSSPIFPLQFYDIYNPNLGGGFYLMTKEKNHIVRKYNISKDEEGIDCSVEFPGIFTQLQPRETFAFSEIDTGVHEGDWHEAVRKYKEWLKTWYVPYKSQDKQWYKECFWLLAEIPDTLEAEIFKFPVWYESCYAGCSKMRYALEEQKRIAGMYPDILHMWSWCYSEEENKQFFGRYGKEDYNKLGGIEKFRSAIDYIQNNMNVAVSLYINATLCHKSLPIAKELGDKGYMKTIDGSPYIVEGTNYRMCHGKKEWLNYIIDIYKRVYKETSARILYVDEFSLLPGNICFSDEHHHENPRNPNKADNAFIKKLRGELPEDVVLYCEFPPIDANSQFIDCNISYYISNSIIEMIDKSCDVKMNDKGLSPLYINLYKFIFPGIVQLVLPIGMRSFSWHALKFTFFNGDAIYDSFWEAGESRCHDFMLKAYKIKKSYSDCFSSNFIETLILTEYEGICANMFQGKKRVLWTLYNRHYITVRGELISIEHKEGAVYYDVWNNRPIIPRIDGDKAYIYLEMEPQSVGCICRTDP